MRSTQRTTHPFGEPAFAAVRLLLVLLCVMMLQTMAGCTKAKGTKAKPVADAGVADEGEADAGEEPEGIDFDTAITVDEDRLEVCSPTGWTRGPQSKDYLVKYIPGRKKTYPSIVVMAADAPNDIAEVDAASHKDLVAAIAASLAETYSKNGKSTLLKKPAAVRLGPHFGVTWAAPATTTVDGMKESIDRTSYAVVFGGRMYSVEIRAPKGKLDNESRAVARAVAAALAPPPAAEEEPAAEPAPAAESAPATER
jgi:hypothetical protein